MINIIHFPVFLSCDYGQVRVAKIEELVISLI